LEDVKMRKIFTLFLPVLTVFPSFVSACGEHIEETPINNGIAEFGFVGGFMSSLLVVAIILLMMVLNNGRKK